ncbi:MAG: NADH-quinone oxidoreductase subunit K, partial [Candidatus Puniceispirillaceae bacterium]
MLVQLASIWNYLIVILLMMMGLFIVISHENLVKKLVGLSIFQTSVFLFYITLGRVSGGTAPILTD